MIPGEVGVALLAGVAAGWTLVASRRDDVEYITRACRRRRALTAAAIAAGVWHLLR